MITTLCSFEMPCNGLRLHYHDFGVIDPPFGARVFVVQMAICGTKTHLASRKS